jgi:hypothetical protein
MYGRFRVSLHGPFGRYAVRLAGWALVAALAGCIRSSQLYPSQPSITFVSLSPSSIVENQGTSSFFTVTLSFTDGDGNLGSSDPNAKNFFYVDQRPGYPIKIPQVGRDSLVLDSIFTANMPPINPSGRQRSFDGTIQIILPGPVRLNPLNSTENATFVIYVVDQAGNRSNRVLTTPLTIRAQ